MRPLEEKRKHLNHLDYEATMLHYCFPEIAKRGPGEDRNVFIEWCSATPVGGGN